MILHVFIQCMCSHLEVKHFGIASVFPLCGSCVSDLVASVFPSRNHLTAHILAAPQDILTEHMIFFSPETIDFVIN